MCVRVGECGGTYGDVEDELLVDVAEEVHVRIFVQGLVGEDALQRVLPIFVEAVDLRAIEGLQQRGLQDILQKPRPAQNEYFRSDSFVKLTEVSGGITYDEISGGGRQSTRK